MKITLILLLFICLLGITKILGVNNPITIGMLIIGFFGFGLMLMIPNTPIELPPAKVAFPWAIWVGVINTATYLLGYNILSRFFPVQQ